MRMTMFYSNQSFLDNFRLIYSPIPLGTPPISFSYLYEFPANNQLYVFLKAIALAGEIHIIWHLMATTTVTKVIVPMS